VVNEADPVQSRVQWWPEVSVLDFRC
jgi:hypothetical protein